MNYFRNIGRSFLGRPMAMTGNPTSGFNGATMGRRMINVGSTTRGVSSLALSDGPMLTARVRKAVMDNPLAANGVTSFIAEVIGTGMRPHSKHEDAITRKLIESEFALWTQQSSATRKVGPDGKPDSLQDFYLQQALVCRNVVEAGEAFARLRPRLADDLSPAGLRVPLQIDLIEPEQLAFWRMSGDMASPQNIIRASIEFNQIHERVAYHFYREHPGDSTIWPNAFEIVRVPAESVLHVMEFVRGNQIRGITSLAPIIVALSDIDEYDDSERFKKKLGAHLFAWLKTLTPDDTNLAQMGQTTVGNDTAPKGTMYAESQPGQVTVLDTNAGEEFGFYSPPDVGTMFEAFMRVERQPLAVAMRVTYAMATGDSTGSNFSRSRIELLGLRRVWQQFQRSVIAHQFCRPVWKAWLDAAAIAGIIDAKDYRKRPEQYMAVEWRAQKWDWVDPVKDVESVRMEIESCLTSREAEIAERSEDIEDVDAAIARDHAREKSLGIVPIYSTRSSTTETAPAGGDAGLPEPATPAKP